MQHKGTYNGGEEKTIKKTIIHKHPNMIVVAFKLGSKINYLVTADGKVDNIWKNKQGIKLYFILYIKIDSRWIVN